MRLRTCYFTERKVVSRQTETRPRHKNHGALHFTIWLAVGVESVDYFSDVVALSYPSAQGTSVD